MSLHDKVVAAAAAPEAGDDDDRDSVQRAAQKRLTLPLAVANAVDDEEHGWLQQPRTDGVAALQARLSRRCRHAFGRCTGAAAAA